VLASSSGVVTNGTGVIETTNNWNSLMTSTLNSSISIPITLASEGPIYIWPRIADNDFGTFSYAIDGTVIGVFNTTPGDAIYTSNGIRNSLGFIRIPGVSAGTHTVSFTQTSSVGTMRIVAIGSLPTTNEMLPLVLVGDPPLQLVMPDAACDTTPSQCEDYLLQIQADVAIFAGDRLNVQFVDNHPYMHATDAEMNDYLHPNPLGHSELRTAFETAIP